jgi:Zinc knuckle
MGRAKYRQQSIGRSKSRGRSKSKGRQFYHCGKEGHMKRNCRGWKRLQNDGKNQKKEDDNKNTTITITAEDVMILSCEEDQCLYVEGH